MKKMNDTNPPLKLVEEDNPPSQPEIMDDTHRLNPDNQTWAPTKTHEPDVDEILNNENIVIDLEQTWADRNKTTPVGWFVLVGLLICSLGGWAILSLFKAQPKIEAAGEAKQEILTEAQKETQKVKQVLHQMEDCARNYLAADSVEARLPYVRHPKRVKPLMEAYYQTHPMHPGEFEQFHHLRSLGLSGFSFVYGNAQLKDGRSSKMLLEEFEDGTFLADWESAVCYQPIEWGRYIEKHPTEPYDMRVLITLDNFYAYEFKDESRFHC